LYVRYHSGPNKSPGDYAAEVFKLSDALKALRAMVIWPTKEDIIASIKTVPVAELADEDFNIQRLLKMGA
jgi:hypothetical protein